MSCATCYEVRLQSCPETITVDAGLTANTEYYWVITTPHGKLYQRKAMTDGQGKLSIDCATLPSGLLTPHAGSFSLEFRRGDEYLTSVGFTVGEKDYTCFLLRFVDVVGDAGENSLISVEGLAGSAPDPTGPYLQLNVGVYPNSPDGSGNFQIYVDKPSTVDWGDGTVEVVSGGKTHYYSGNSGFSIKVYHKNLITAFAAVTNYHKITSIDGDWPSNDTFFQVALGGKMDVMPTFPVSVKSLELSANRFTVADVDALIDSLVTNGEINGALQINLQVPPAHPTTSGLDTLYERNWQIITD